MNSVVIGSGFGGIAAALRLKAKGHNVTLIEKHPDLGGRARVFKKNGFTYDGGPTVITAPYLINELFELFKKDPKNYIKLSPLKVWYQFVFEDNSKFNYSGNENEMKSQIAEMSKDDVIGYEKLVNFTKKIFDKGFTELADVPFDKPLVMMRQLPALLKLKSYKSVYSLVSSYIKNEKLLKPNFNNHFMFSGKKNRMEYSMGLFVYYFGTKKKYENVEHHTIKFGNKYKEHLDDIFNNKKLNNDISYYLHRPSATDKSMAPEGQDCFYVLVPVPNNQSKIDWSIEGEKMKNLVIDKMEKDLMPNLRKNIIEDFYLTPDYFEKDLNTKYGSGFSIQPKFSQSAYFRFHNKSEIYDGLYFVGAGTHPGAGVPGVLSSAKVLDKIL